MKKKNRDRFVFMCFFYDDFEVVAFFGLFFTSIQTDCFTRLVQTLFCMEVKRNGSSVILRRLEKIPEKSLLLEPSAFVGFKPLVDYEG